MSDRDTLNAEATRKLEKYRATGYRGFWQQGIDRLTALGYHFAELQGSDADVSFLLFALETGLVG